MSENTINEKTTEALNEDVTTKLVEDETTVTEEKVEDSDTNIENVVKSKSVREAAPTTDGVVTAPAIEQHVPGLGPVADGVLGTSLVSKTEKPKMSVSKSKTDNSDKVAIFSTKNVTWSAIGSKIYRGYNIVKPEIADQWLTKDFVRLATPEEVAREFGL